MRISHSRAELENIVQWDLFSNEWRDTVKVEMRQQQNRTEKKKKPSTQQNLWWLHPINVGERKKNVMFLFSFFYITITSRVSAAVKSNKWIYYWHVYVKMITLFSFLFRCCYLMTLPPKKKLTDHTEEKTKSK